MKHSAQALALIVVTMLGFGSSAVAAAGGPTDENAPSEFRPSTATRIVTVDDREIRVTLSGFLISITTAAAGTANMSVQLEAVDGGPLPEGLSAEHIRIERVRAPTRVVHRDLIGVDLFPDADESTAEYGLESGIKVAARGARFRGTIRLGTSDGDVFVRMGTFWINPALLENPEPIDPPDLTPAQ